MQQKYIFFPMLMKKFPIWEEVSQIGQSVFMNIAI